MPRATGQRIAGILGVGGAVALVTTAIAMWPYLVESWHIRRLES